MKKYSFILLIFLLLACKISGSAVNLQNLEDSCIVKISITEGTNMALALSPDNKTIAIDLQGTIWIMSSTGGKANLLLMIWEIAMNLIGHQMEIR